MPRPTGSPRWPHRSRPPIDVLTHPALAQLHPTFGHPDSPERLEVLLEAFPDAREGRAAERSAAERVHAPEYLNRLATLTEPGLWDADTVVSETSWTAALLAAGIAIEAAETGAFALVRPPGHHARPRTAMGFCLVNNVAVAARHMQAEHGVGRVAIVDYDVHHGNGTQEIFWEDDSVLFVSLHQWPFYPGTGGPTEQSETTVNVPLSAGSGDDEYLLAFDQRVAPAVEQFGPELLLVSAGFDAHEEDPLAQMRISADGFRELSRRCAALAPRVAAVLEGGYNVATLPGSGHSGAGRILLGKDNGRLRAGRRNQSPRVVRSPRSLRPGERVDLLQVSAGGPRKASPETGEGTHPKWVRVSPARWKEPRALPASRRRRAFATGSSHASERCARR